MLKSLTSMLAGFAAVVLLLAPTAGEARTLDDIIRSGNVKIGVHPNIPPLSYRDTDGNWQGFDIDIGRIIADKIGVEAEFVGTEWKTRVPNLVTELIDFSMAALTRNSKRMKVIDFTFPLHTENLAVLITDKVEGVSTWKDLDRNDLTMVGCRGCFPVQWMKDNVPNAKVLVVDSGSDMVRTIAQGRADGMIANLEWHRRFTKNYPDVNWVILESIIKTSYCALGVKKGNYSLRDFLNAALYEIQSADIHNQIWEKHWGRPPLVKVEAQPYW